MCDNSFVVGFETSIWTQNGVVRACSTLKCLGPFSLSLQTTRSRLFLSEGSDVISIIINHNTIINHCTS